MFYKINTSIFPNILTNPILKIKILFIFFGSHLLCSGTLLAEYEVSAIDPGCLSARQMYYQLPVSLASIVKNLIPVYENRERKNH